MSDLSLPAADLLVALVIPSVLYGMYLVTLRIAEFLLLSTHAGRDPAMGRHSIYLFTRTNAEESDCYIAIYSGAVPTE
jgi:hypothetical protein